MERASFLAPGGPGLHIFRGLSTVLLLNFNMIQLYLWNFNLVSLNYCKVEMIFFLSQGQTMMAADSLKSWPQKKWMMGSKKPPLYQWLKNSKTEMDTNRLSTCGNIVVPVMAYFASQCLHAMSSNHCP